MPRPLNYFTPTRRKCDINDLARIFLCFLTSMVWLSFFGDWISVSGHHGDILALVSLIAIIYGYLIRNKRLNDQIVKPLKILFWTLLTILAGVFIWLIISKSSFQAGNGLSRDSLSERLDIIMRIGFALLIPMGTALAFQKSRNDDLVPINPKESLENSPQSDNRP